MHASMEPFIIIDGIVMNNKYNKYIMTVLSTKDGVGVLFYYSSRLQLDMEWESYSIIPPRYNERWSDPLIIKSMNVEIHQHLIFGVIEIPRFWSSY